MRVLSELYRFRSLALALAHRELTVRYKRSVFGVMWGLAEPLVLVGVYLLVFGVLFGVRREVENYPLFALLGLLPWLFFSSSIEGGTGALLENAPLLRKVFFPSELLVASTIFSRFTTLVIALAVCVAAMVALELNDHDVALARLWWFLPGLALALLFTSGLTLALASMNTLLRDIGFLARFFLRLGFYAVPIVYHREMVPEGVRPLYDLNPLVSIVMLFQGAASATLPAPSAGELAMTSLTCIVVFAGGWTIFRRLRPAVADAL